MPNVNLIQSGDLLISEPFLPDPNFMRSVVYLVEHNKEGTIGFVLNQPMGLTLADVLQIENAEGLDIPVYNGGPVANDTLHVIHQLGDHVPGSKYVGNHIYWGGDFEHIRFLLANKNADERDFRFFVGYSGWGAGQLQEELKQKSWIRHRVGEEMVFNDNPEKLWAEVLKNKGGRYKLISGSPLHPDWN